MAEFDPEKFEEKYVNYFEELETAYSNAYQSLHGQCDSEILQRIDRQILSESEPVYEGDGDFRVVLPEDTAERAASLPGDEETVKSVLKPFTDAIEQELQQMFEFEE
ncbi:DUF5783 family protein [Haloarcula salina]|uniref:Uncharacterized protein n=1 Tax=Haloarcula salina TaxID=1429914 RepID=A0AA41KGU2_9EURY|nr:DUF5783 family protein [Haloarcula salina]MBV0903492.1 hypothetical protein [Haloarcula salina]